ncbi:AAA family ATPase [Methanomassiliicoccus luminyensis]|uniref:AAA family ATPase n=1 Tax=Methanomassiliicoccus luminyensis TaxID=1080712 RepID=UPI00138AECC5|nr:ATP-binding protein [Methanomassiliicoccus luminyensis]
MDREDEIKRLLILVEGVQNGAASNSVIAGLRRTGKTSVLYQISEHLDSNKKIIPVIVNCYGIASKPRLARILIDSVIDSYVKKTGDKAYLRRFKIIVDEAAKAASERVSEVSLRDFTVKLREKDVDEVALLEDALRFAETLAGEKEVYFLIMFDEFQDIIRWGEGTLKRMRTVIQSQSRVCYIFAGSATTIMHELVYDTRSPFYRQLVEVPIGKLREEVVHSFLEKRLGSVGIKASNAVSSRIVTLSEGFPDYVQRLGLELYLSVGPGGSLTEADVNKVYEDMLIGLDGEFETYFSSFSPLEREILIALSLGMEKPSEIAREVRKPIVNISKTLKLLLNCGVLERPRTGYYRMSDPVFFDWVHQRFKTIN